MDIKTIITAAVAKNYWETVGRIEELRIKDTVDKPYRGYQYREMQEEAVEEYKAALDFIDTIDYSKFGIGKRFSEDNEDSWGQAIILGPDDLISKKEEAK